MGTLRWLAFLRCCGFSSIRNLYRSFFQFRWLQKIILSYFKWKLQMMMISTFWFQCEVMNHLLMSCFFFLVSSKSETWSKVSSYWQEADRLYFLNIFHVITIEFEKTYLASTFPACGKLICCLAFCRSFIVLFFLETI